MKRYRVSIPQAKAIGMRGEPRLVHLRFEDAHQFVYSQTHKINEFVSDFTFELPAEFIWEFSKEEGETHFWVELEFFNRTHSKTQLVVLVPEELPNE